MRAGIVNNQYVAFVYFGQGTVYCKAVVAFAKGADNIINVVMRGVFLASTVT